MKLTEFVRVDSKGRITLSSSARSLIGIRKGMYVMIVADADRREVRISPFADPEAELAEFRIEMSDLPGSLAKIAKVLANAGVDLLASESRTIKRKDLAEWHIIADISKKTCSIDELKRRIIKEGGAGKVELREFVSKPESER